MAWGRGVNPPPGIIMKDVPDHASVSLVSLQVTTMHVRRLEDESAFMPPVVY